MTSNNSVNLVFESHSDWFSPTVCSFLRAAEALSFATTSKANRCLRVAQELNTPEGWQAGYIWRNAASNYSSVLWQNLPLGVLRETGTLGIVRGLHTVFVSMHWRDQGWGNRKGMVAVVDVTNNNTPDAMTLSINSDCVVAGAHPAPHALEYLRLSFQPKTDESSYALWTKAGGGGGHSLEILECKIHGIVYV